MSALSFSAVLLAGGKSQRMGRDKALLTLPDGRLLWQRQLDDVLRPLQPAEIFFSGPARPGLPADVTVLADETSESSRGPLAGIAAALGAMRTPLLAVLAVDLPAMTAEFFRVRLLPDCALKMGAVPRNADGFFEPLAAIYPREAHALAQTHLRETDRSMQAFVRAALALGMIQSVDLSAADEALFINWNTPSDQDAIS